MRLSNSGPGGDGDWQPMSDSLNWSLVPGEGTRIVHLEVRDAAGLVTAVDASIVRTAVEPIEPPYWLILLVVILVVVTATLVIWIGRRAAETSGEGHGETATVEERRVDEDTIKEVARLHHVLMNRPGGLPTSLWGWDISDLAEAIVYGPKREMPDGTTVVELNGRWYRVDADPPEMFLDEVEVD